MQLRHSRLLLSRQGQSADSASIGQRIMAWDPCDKTDHEIMSAMWEHCTCGCTLVHGQTWSMPSSSSLTKTPPMHSCPAKLGYATWNSPAFQHSLCPAPSATRMRPCLSRASSVCRDNKQTEALRLQQAKYNDVTRVVMVQNWPLIVCCLIYTPWQVCITSGYPSTACDAVTAVQSPQACVNALKQWPCISTGSNGQSW